jgi:hypothetical protein
MNLFKKLCKQNQQWKYAFLTKKLHELTGEHVKQRKAARAAAVAAHGSLVETQQGTTLPPEEEPIGLAICQDFIPPPS